MKLSNVQLSVLNEIKKPGVKLYYMGYMGRFNPSAYWFISKSMKRVRCSTVKALANAGYIKYKDKIIGGYPMRHEAFYKESTDTK